MSVSTVNLLKEYMRKDEKLTNELFKKLIKHGMYEDDISKLLGVEVAEIKEIYKKCLVHICMIEDCIAFSKCETESEDPADIAVYLLNNDNIRDEVRNAVNNLSGQALVDTLWKLGTDSMKIEYIRQLKRETGAVVIHEMKYGYENIESLVDKVIKCGGAV